MLYWEKVTIGKLYKDMSPEEQKKHKELTERYRKENPELYRKNAREYYYRNKENP